MNIVDANISSRPLSSSTKQLLETELSIRIGRLIGQGTYNRVYIATDLSRVSPSYNQKGVFALRVSKDPLSKKEASEEGSLIMEMSKERIGVPVKKTLLLRDKRSPTNYQLVVLMEYGNTLDNLLERSSKSAYVMKSYATRLVDLIEKTAEKGYVYLDIKPENIVLKDTFHFIDFGNDFVTSTDGPTCHRVLRTKCLFDIASKRIMISLFKRIMLVMMVKSMRVFSKLLPDLIEIEAHQRSFMESAFPKTIVINGKNVRVSSLVKRLLPDEKKQGLDFPYIFAYYFGSQWETNSNKLRIMNSKKNRGLQHEPKQAAEKGSVIRVKKVLKKTSAKKASPDISINNLFKMANAVRPTTSAKSKPTPNTGSRGWNENLVTSDDTNLRLNVDATQRAQVVKIRNKFSDYREFLLQKDEESASRGVRFSSYIEPMMEIYKKILKKQSRVHSKSVASAAILSKLKRSSNLDEDVIFGLDRSGVKSKHLFLKKHESIFHVSPRNKESALSKTIDDILQDLDPIRYTRHKKRIVRYEKAYEAFEQEHEWFRKIKGAPKMKVRALLAFMVKSSPQEGKMRLSDPDPVVLGSNKIAKTLAKQIQTKNITLTYT